MNKIDKININIIDFTEILGESSLTLKIQGPNIDYIIMNTLRRIIMSYIPIYAFTDFKIEKNTSVFHNNYLKLRLKQLPVWGIKNNIPLFDIQKEKTNTIDETEETEDNEELIETVESVEPSKENQNQITMYVNQKNKTNEIITISTDSAKFYYNDKLIVSPYPQPIQLVKLQPSQEIVFSALTNIGVEEQDTIFTAVCIVAYKQITDNEFDFTLESRGQINEKRILHVALINIEEKLKKFIKYIDNMTIDEKIDNGLIIVNDEDHTFGNLIARGMQKHDNISFAGYNLPHPLTKIVHFNYKLKKGNIKKILQDVIDYYLELFELIKKQIK